jgi:hypothetical protein
MEDLQKVKARCLLRNSTLKEAVILVKSQPIWRPEHIQHLPIVRHDHGIVGAPCAAAVSLTVTEGRC